MWSNDLILLQNLTRFFNLLGFVSLGHWVAGLDSINYGQYALFSSPRYRFYISNVKHISPIVFIFHYLQSGRKTTDETELLFQMLKCFSSHLLPQYQFFKDFLQETVAQSYPVEWKRTAFFKFAELFHDAKYSQEMKAKVKLCSADVWMMFIFFFLVVFFTC